MKLTKTLLFVFLGIFLVSSVSASLVYADWSDGTKEATITNGNSISFNVDFFTMHPPMTISAILYDSSDNVVYTFVEQSVSGNSFSETYTITPSIYLTTGTYELILNAKDKVNHQDSDSILLTVSPSTPTPTNNAPVITSTAITSVNESTAYSYDVQATDADGNTLTYSLTSSPTWLTINSATGLISGTSPSVTSNTDYSVTVQVSDGTATATQTYTLTVNNVPVTPPVNNAPVITSTPPVVTIYEGDPYTYDVSATDADIGDVLTYSLTSAPSWLTINSATGLISGTAPSVSSDTDYTITVQVSDGTDTATQTYTLTVENTSSGGGSSNVSGGVKYITTSQPTKPTTGGATPITPKTVKKPEFNIMTLFYVMLGLVSCGIVGIVFFIGKNFAAAKAVSSQNIEQRESYY